MTKIFSWFRKEKKQTSTQTIKPTALSCDVTIGEIMSVPQHKKNLQTQTNVQAQTK